MDLENNILNTLRTTWRVTAYTLYIHARIFHILVFSIRLYFTCVRGEQFVNMHILTVTEGQMGRTDLINDSSRAGLES